VKILPSHGLALFVVESAAIIGLFALAVRLSEPPRRRLIGALIGGGVVGLLVPVGIMRLVAGVPEP
jgi:hypothetical protein